ncbi:MAG: acetone carboxylase subunit gamma, partial [Deltaproteobacteria bacterium]|nr:acetone carboxylase subunit gamma [Deltaproteobacteria bacterium]
MPEYDISEIEKLVDGKLPWPRVQEIMKDAKDTDRFEKWLEILQCRVP